MSNERIFPFKTKIANLSPANFGIDKWIINGLRLEFKTDYHFFSEFNSKTGDIEIFCGTNFEIVPYLHKVMMGQRDYK